MAKRVKRRRGSKGRFVKAGGASNPPRRRRRHHKNPASSHRRRRHSAATMHRNSHHRRRHRRNPAARGVIGAVVKGVGRGVAVAGGQLLARKARGGLQGVVTTKANVSTGLPGLATTAGAALAGTIAHMMLTPAKHRALGDFVVAGMWAEAVNFGLALTPAAPYLSAFPPRSPALRIIDNSPRGARNLGAYHRQAGRLSAYSRGGATFGAYTRQMGVPVSAGSGPVGY
jgi:hypothetical protein